MNNVLYRGVYRPAASSESGEPSCYVVTQEANCKVLWHLTPGNPAELVTHGQDRDALIDVAVAMTHKARGFKARVRLVTEPQHKAARRYLFLRRYAVRSAAGSSIELHVRFPQRDEWPDQSAEEDLDCAIDAELDADRVDEALGVDRPALPTPP